MCALQIFIIIINQQTKTATDTCTYAYYIYFPSQVISNPFFKSKMEYTLMLLLLVIQVKIIVLFTLHCMLIVFINNSKPDITQKFHVQYITMYATTYRMPTLYFKLNLTNL